VKTDYDPEVGGIDAIEHDLSRVFLNVITNAIYAATQKKATSRGSAYAPEIRIATRDLGERVEVRVRDNGAGIPESVVDKIFMPFFTTKPPGEGTGLGLSISHEIVVDAHRGEMRVETAPGEFTEFIITLPRTAKARG
jgi:signal transduction histidine kinase